MEVVDRYLWVPERKVNVKVREQDLKFKYLLDRANEGIENWREVESENYPFPLSSTVVAELETALGTKFPADMAGKTLETHQSLLDVLARSNPPVTLIAFEKLIVSPSSVGEGNGCQEFFNSPEMISQSSGHRG